MARPSPATTRALPSSSLSGAHRNHGSAILCAFDLLEIDGEDLRREPIEHASIGSPGYCDARTMALP